MPFDPASRVPIPAGRGDVLINDFPPVGQGGYANLCWAACAAMVMDHLRRPVSLDQVVVVVLGSFQDRTEWPQVAYGKLGVDCRFADTVNAAELLDMLGKGYPAQPYIEWNNGSGFHVLIVSGMYADGKLRLYDPLYGDSSVNTLYDLMSGYQEGRMAGLWYGMTLER